MKFLKSDLEIPKNDALFEAWLAFYKAYHFGYGRIPPTTGTQYRNLFLQGSRVYYYTTETSKTNQPAPPTPNPPVRAYEPLVSLNKPLINPYPRHPKSFKYLVNRCLEPLKAFSGDIWRFKHRSSPGVWMSRVISEWGTLGGCWLIGHTSLPP